MIGGYEIALWILLLGASVTDLLWGKVHNALTFTFLAGALVCRLAVEGFSGGQEALLSLAVAFTLFFPLWILKAFKAGDVKLVMAASVLLSPKSTVLLALAAILVGAMVGAIVLLQKTGVRGGLLSLKNHLRTKQDRVKSVRMPFAPAFFCAFCFVRIAEIHRWQIF